MCLLTTQQATGLPKKCQAAPAAPPTSGKKAAHALLHFTMQPTLYLHINLYVLRYQLLNNQAKPQRVEQAHEGNHEEGMQLQGPQT
jgi:hypothetical protein